MPSHTPDPPAARPERRRDPRKTFTTLLRPQLRTSFDLHQVLNVSLTGLLLAHVSPARPRVGDIIRGTLEWPQGQAPLSVSGTVVRVMPREVALSLDRGLIPMGYLP